jgi:hypothetical protein
MSGAGEVAGERSRPALSVVLVADRFEQVRRVVGDVAGQDGADRIELVLVGPSAAALEPGPEVRARLGRVTLVAHDAHRVMHRSRAAGVRVAGAPLVAFAETHAFPQPGWGAALIAAFDDGATVVGPAMLLANPRTAVAWSNFILDYGPFAEPVEQWSPSIGLPGHNSAYRRADLLGYGDRLEEMLRLDWLMVADLGRSGGTLRLEPRARTAHLNVTRPRYWLLERLVCGRMFAACRAAGWSRRRRLLFALASPVIPIRRARRVLADLRRTVGPQPSSLRVALALAVGLVVQSAGEHLGYAYGLSRRAEVRAYEMELERARYVHR